jgi:trehalose 6-phosphate synthase/phosphatase
MEITKKNPKVIVVSNRLPVTINVGTDGQCKIERSVGGLATGLQTLVEQQSCVWVGWPGKTSSLSSDRQDEIFASLKSQKLVPVSLTDTQVKNFYEDYCNGVLWPLFHSLIGQLPMVFSGYEDYVKVNQIFAEKVAEIYEDGDIVWVHDTHLMLLPSILRSLKPCAKIGFFFTHSLSSS